MKIAVVLMIALAAVGQTQKPGIGATEENSANLPVQKIGANDLIFVSVYGSPELSRSVRVGPDGYIRLAMMKQRIKVEGLMPVEVEVAIAASLKHEQILVDPYVTVNVAEYHSRPISVMGAVKNPLTFQADGGITLLDALARADGLSPEAGPEILVSRTQSGETGTPTSLVQRIPIKGLLDSADPELNVKLNGGEEIRVPVAGKVFVVGNVKSPGAFPVQEDSETSLLKALSLAGGLAPLANNEAYILRREANGTKNEIPVHLSKIMDRKAPDVPLLPNDILYVPDAKGKRATFATLERVLSFGTAASAAVLYGSVR